MYRVLGCILIGVGLAACARPPDRALVPEAAMVSPEAGPARPRIVETAAFLQCVPYARSLSGIEIRGDAWTWWRQAEGRFTRSRVPAAGAVLVLQRGARLDGGHIAVVSRVIDSRQILARHANWLNRGRIHLDTPIIDVSPGNDWSAVRIWYTPGDTLGRSTYPAHGFIYPPQAIEISS